MDAASIARLEAVVIGGLIGPDETRREALLAEFMDHCRRHGWTACFGLVSEHDLPLFDRVRSSPPRSVRMPSCGSRYCSIWPKASLRPLHAMLSTWGTLQFSPWRALGRGIRRLRIRRQRATLVQS